MAWRAIGLLVMALLCWPLSVSAEADANTYALVIGANRGGQGQATLRYATQDARRVADLLVELGRTRRDQIELLIEPTPGAVEQALERLRSRLTSSAQAGHNAKLLFYYSGHAQ